MPRTILQENPRQNPRIFSKNPRHISAEGPGQYFGLAFFRKSPANFSANSLASCSLEFSALFFQGVSPLPQKNSPQNSRPKLSAFLQPQIFENIFVSRRFSAYGGDHQFFVGAGRSVLTDFGGLGTGCGRPKCVESIQRCPVEQAQRALFKATCCDRSSLPRHLTRLLL